MSISGLHVGGLGSQGVDSYKVTVRLGNSVKTMWSPKETRALSPAGTTGGSAYAATQNFDDLGTTQWITIGCYFYQDKIDANGLMGVPIIHILSPSGTEAYIGVTDFDTPGVNDTLTLGDADGWIADVGGVFGSGWHLVVFKYKRDGSSEYKVEVNGELVLEGTGLNAYKGPGSPYVIFGLRDVYDPSPGPPLYTTWLGSTYVVMDDGIAIDSENTMWGPFVILGPYQSTNSSRFSDFGPNNMPRGYTWSYVAELPLSTINYGRFSFSFGDATKEGGVTCDGGNRSGPHGDPDATTIAANRKMAQWNWYVKEFGGNLDFDGMWGSQDISLPTVDNTTKTAFGDITTTYVWHHQTIGPEHPQMPDPDSSGVFQYGTKFTKKSGLTPHARIGEIYVYMLQTEGPESLAASGDLFIEGLAAAEIFTSGDLYTLGSEIITTSGDLFVHGHAGYGVSDDLYINGYEDVSISGNLFIGGCVSVEISGGLFIGGHELLTISGDMFVYGHTHKNTSYNLYIRGHENVVASDDLFIKGLMKVSGIPSPSLFIQGHDVAQTSGDLFVFGSQQIGSSGDLFVYGRESFYALSSLFINGFIRISGVSTPSLFIQGHETTFVSGNLFISGSGIIEINNSITIIINGYEPKSALVCPVLDPTATVQIEASLISTYQSLIDSMINQLGKNVLLEFDPVRESCPNCEFDMIRKRSIGVYKLGGPRPFTRGQKCPYCKGRGFLEMSSTKCIKCLIQWGLDDDGDDDEDENSNITVDYNKGVIQLKTYITEIDDLIRARTIIINHDVVDRIKLRAILIRGPTPVGLREDRYCISFWELI